MELVRFTYLPRNTVSSVTRPHRVAPSMLFRWRTLDKQEALTAIQAGSCIVSFFLQLILFKCPLQNPKYSSEKYRVYVRTLLSG